MSQQMEQDVLRHLRMLSDEQQQRVLDYARSITEGAAVNGRIPHGTPGNALLRFAGAIPAEELQQMSQVIEEQCERIDAADWQLSA